MTIKRVLIIKTSSLGDVIHTLPALTDARAAIPDIEFDWVVEKSFSEIPSWHSAVNKVIPVEIRKWRKTPIKSIGSDAWKNFRQSLKETTYDAVIDAQGLLKSALLTPMTTGPRYGYDKYSARESMSSHLYDHKISVSKNIHAVERIRQLFASSLGYAVPERIGDYDIKAQFKRKGSQEPYIVMLHGTTWASKHYPDAYWLELISLATDANLNVKLFWGNDTEFQRANKLAESFKDVEVMPKLNLSEIANLLASANGAITVDTGLGHLAAAVDCPTLSLYQSTNPELSSTYGLEQKYLATDFNCAPCMKRICNLPAEIINIGSDEISIHPPCATKINPENVWKSFMRLIYIQ